MMDQTTIDLILNLGFPIFVAIWFMFRTDKRLDKMIELLTKMAHCDDDEAGVT